MNREFFTASLTTKPALLRAMLAFNGLLSPQELPGALANLPQAAALWANPTVRRRFHASCVADPDFWDFENEVTRLAMLAAPTLKRLALTFGVAVLAPEICRLLRREAVQRVRERLGEGLYSYALHRARFQVQDGMISRKYIGFDGFSIEVRAVAIGAWGLAALSRSWPEPLRSHFVLPAAPPAPDTAPLAAAQHTTLWMAMKKVLLKEVAPSWAPCFD